MKIEKSRFRKFSKISKIFEILKIFRKIVGHNFDEFYFSIYSTKLFDFFLWIEVAFRDATLMNFIFRSTQRIFLIFFYGSKWIFEADSNLLPEIASKLTGKSYFTFVPIWTPKQRNYIIAPPGATFLRTAPPTIVNFLAVPGFDRSVMK